MTRENGLRIRLKKVFSDAELQTLVSEPVKEGWMWCIEHTAWEIDKATSGGNTRCRLYISTHGYKHNIAEQDAPAADTLYTWSKNEYLYPGERWALDIDEGQASTTAEMCLTGYKEEIKNA